MKLWGESLAEMDRGQKALLMVAGECDEMVNKGMLRGQIILTGKGQDLYLELKGTDFEISAEEFQHAFVALAEVYSE